MEQKANTGYMKGFIPYAIAAGMMSLCGGFTSSVPATIVSLWEIDAIWTTWITLAFSLGAAAFAPIMGKLGDVYGRRKILLTSMAIYALGQVIIAFCPAGSIPIVLAGRFIVGIGGAGIAPSVMAYIMMEFPPQELGKGFSIYMLVSCGMVIFGPTLGGIVISMTGTYYLVMYICVAIAVAGLLACMVMIPKVEYQTKSMEGFDYVGAVFVLVFFSLFLAVPTLGQNFGWTASSTLMVVGAALVALVILFSVEKKATQPMLNGGFMARKAFVLPVVVLFLSQGLMQSCMTNVITFNIVTGGSSTMSGIAVSLMYFGMALGTVLIGPQADKREPRVVAAAALVLVAIGAAMQMMFSAQTSAAVMYVSLFLVGLGLGGNGTIFLKVVLAGLDPASAGSGSGTYNVFRDMSAPFGVALFVPMFTSGYTTGMASYMAEGMDQGAALVAAAVDSIKSTGMIQTVCVVIGIGVCLMLPKIREQA